MNALRGPLSRNLAARVLDLASLTVATVFVAHLAGATGIGWYVLLRVLPSLCAVLMACGLPSAMPYFLACEKQYGPQLRSTLLWLLTGGALLAALAWLALIPVVGPVFFVGVPQRVLLLAGVAAATQLAVAAARGWIQGRGDARAGDVMVGLEELCFLPAFAVLALVPIDVPTRIVGALVLADLVVAGPAWWHLRRTGALRGAGCRPSGRLARQVVSFGLRGQASSLLTLLNLRLDVALLGALAGPAVLGVYAVASKYAEVLRLPGLAVNFVLYPAFRREGPEPSAPRVRRLAGRLLLTSAGLALALIGLAPVLLPAVFGRELAAATWPAIVLTLGLVVDAAAAVVLAWLYAAGRPGLCSLGAASGLIVTVVLDLLLIPRYGAIGAAVASGLAYGVAATVLWWCFRRVCGGASTHRPLPALAGTRS